LPPKPPNPDRQRRYRIVDGAHRDLPAPPSGIWHSPKRPGSLDTRVFPRLIGDSVQNSGSDKFMYDDALFAGAMAKGEVDFFNDTGGYGFIDTDESDEDVFFHMEDIGGPDLEEGQEVEFDIVQADKGPRAENLERL
jgi:CspA family cold shock protein